MGELELWSVHQAPVESYLKFDSFILFEQVYLLTNLFHDTCKHDANMAKLVGENRSSRPERNIDESSSDGHAKPIAKGAQSEDAASARTHRDRDTNRDISNVPRNASQHSHAASEERWGGTPGAYNTRPASTSSRDRKPRERVIPQSLVAEEELSSGQRLTLSSFMENITENINSQISKSISANLDDRFTVVEHALDEVQADLSEERSARNHLENRVKDLEEDLRGLFSRPPPCPPP